MTDPAAHTPSDSAGVPDVDTLEKGVAWILSRAAMGETYGSPAAVYARECLSDLAATSRRVAELEAALREIAGERERPNGRVGWHDVTAKTPRDIARAALAGDGGGA